MLILCKGTVAKEPYEMPFTGVKVYSLEELCYYIYNNIYSITEDFFEPSLAVWLREETGAVELANKMDKMIAAKESIKNYVVTLLCSCDYYREEEIRPMIDVADEIANLPLYKKKKMKADNYLRAGLYGRSLSEYRNLLHGSFAVNFTMEEYGDILHNQGIARFYTSSFEEAGRDFKEAFIRNNKRDSLEHYLYVLLLQGKEEEAGAEAINAGMQEDEFAVLKQHFVQAEKLCQMPQEEETDIDTYKEELRTSLV